ncbi:uncharacterized protein [Palaemon carinicauda]|uniref:uncharacterized protein n=1 Tax=Palaemon carinicauda TaxID=392227 RepID=UPI0035B67168
MINGQVYEKLQDGMEIITPEMEFAISFGSIVQCALRASMKNSAYFGIRRDPGVLKCYLSSTGALADSLQETTNPTDSVWALLTTSSTPTGTSGTSTAAPGGVCTICDTGDSSSWGIIPGQVGCSTFNMCSANGVTSQSCPATLVLSSAGACDYTYNVDTVCMC